jgi:Flp pilus assembly protein TadG
MISNNANRCNEAGPRLRKGVTLLETALVMPVVLSLIFGAIEFGYVIFVKQTLQAASREGARRAVIATATDSGVKKAVVEAMKAGGLGNTGYTVAIKNASTGAPSSVSDIPPGAGVCVEVTAPWNQYSVFLSGFGDWSRANLTSRTVMRRED